MMIKRTLLLFILLFQRLITVGQPTPRIDIVYSKLLATYDFVQKLSDNYPDNNYKQLFKSSAFNSQSYTDLVKQLDTLNIHETYRFQGYPIGQKRPVMTSSLIERNLINASNIDEFKQTSFGIIPNAELFALSALLSDFEPVYDSLVYAPNRYRFKKQLDDLTAFVNRSDLSAFFKKGLAFYGSQWDSSIPIRIAVIPIISNTGFTAKAFLNNAVSEVPLDYKHNDVLFSVLMHEIYHNLYDGQSLQLQLQIESWFKHSTSRYAQYAYLLFNEAMATALGNGYVYEQLNGKPDSGDWYNVKYINLMAKQMYPLVKKYFTDNRTIDKAFIDSYVAAYDTHFPDWVNELDHLFTNRYVVADTEKDLAYFSRKYRYSSIYQAEVPITPNALEHVKGTPVTKVVVVSSNHNKLLQSVKNSFPELKSWKYRSEQEFIYTTDLKDKTRLILINRHSTPLDSLLERTFKNRRIDSH